MSQVLRGPNSRCAIEVLRTDGEAVLAMLDTDCQVALVSHPLAWAEIGEQFKEGKRWFEFDQVWQPLTRCGPQGIEPYPLFEAVRKIIRGCFSAPAGFKGGALEALADILPHGDIHLFTREWGFIGRFSAVEDAQMIAAALKAVKPIIFGSPEEFLELVDLDQAFVLSDLGLGEEWPAKLNMTHAIGVMEMAKAKTKSKAKKVAKAEASQRRADGPVAKARAIFEKMRDETDSSKIIKACEDAGVNRGTATTQLGRWRKENGITVKRGGARKKKAEGDKSADKKTESPKTDSKGEKKKNLPKSKKKGEKRHKPSNPSSNTTSTPASTSAAAPVSQSPASQAAPAQAVTATASQAAGTATTAPASQGATSSGTAGGAPTTGDQSVKREPSPGPTPKK